MTMGNEMTTEEFEKACAGKTIKEAIVFSLDMNLKLLFTDGSSVLIEGDCAQNCGFLVFSKG